IELLAGMRRMLPMQIQDPESQLLIQRILGQVLFYPPNVAGWPAGNSWIDSSTLMMRMRLPQLLNHQDVFNISLKLDDDQMMGREDYKNVGTAGKKGRGMAGKPISVEINWTNYLKNFDAVPRPSLMDSLSQSLLQVKPSYSTELLKAFTDESKKETFIKSATIQIMSTPEYQMC
ncbi:MAG TPA: DUF1800 family protein, partial [Flavisolibacter sp.]|nr:DUF1800 family protein [Flavisolibacter sp.]